LPQAEAELVAVEPRRAEAEQIAAEARLHVPEVVEARHRIEELRLEIPRREPLVVAADAELAELRGALADAVDLLAQTQQANAVTRRLRRLPRPEEQQAMIESLEARAQRLSLARDETVKAVESLNREFREAEETVALHGHLPNPNVAAEEARALREAEDNLRREIGELQNDVERFSAELTEIGDPLGRFQESHGRGAAEVDAQARNLREQLEAVSHDLGFLRTQADHLRQRVEEGLQGRLEMLQRLGAVQDVPEAFEEQLAAIEATRLRAADLLAGVSIDRLREELREIERRLREISARLGEIEEAIKAVEELVVAEASIVATTLTRAYKRESVYKRRFDTVILDEASMAPIPALWVVAGRADTNVVIVGDFKQLPPIKHSTHPLAEDWLGRDIFEVAGIKENYESGNPPPHLVILREQHRMHPKISAIANRFIYDGKLRDAPEVVDDGPLAGWFQPLGVGQAPVLLVDTSGLNAWVTSVSHGGRTSRLNFLSATVCVDLAEMLLRPDRPSFEPGTRPRVLVCAPYRPQMKVLALLLREQGLAGEVNAGTAHTFQGNEAPVMIFDLVNDEPHWRVGMFNPNHDENTKRLLNVALTRAQRRLIVVGDFAWIERQAGRGSFLRRLVHELKEQHPVVDARELLPAGLAARTAAAHASAHISREEPVPPQLVVTETFFFDYLARDLAEASNRVVIYSPFAAYERVGRLEPHLRAAVERGVEVWVVTKPLEERSGDRGVYEQIESGLRGWGIQIAHKRRMHEKLIFIDDHILWAGSLNPLSQSTTQEVMERRDSRAIVDDYTKLLRLDELIGAYRAGETICPYCGSEVVAAEGRDDAYYWRCVVDDCFSRSIGDPMPIDGKVVCRTCNGPLEFRWPNERPFWRCTLNHRHRQPFTRSHLRLPAMCELIPASDFRRLRKQFEQQEQLPFG
jgi:hypothetical protein